MNKYWLIIRKEYLERVKKWSFILTTLLAPLFFIGIFGIQAFFIAYSSDVENYLVVDKSNLKWEKLTSTSNVDLTYSLENYEDLKQNYKQNNFDGILYIPSLQIDKPQGIEYYSDELLGIRTKTHLEFKIENALKNLRYKNAGIDKTAIKNLHKNISIAQIGIEQNKSSDTIAATVVGYISGFIIYFVLIFYGMMVMKGVAEEKTNRIVEVMLSSVKPIQLMLGKIVGIGLVGLTQFAIWILLIFSTVMIFATIFSPDLSGMSIPEMSEFSDQNGLDADMQKKVAEAIQTISSINFTPIIIGFIFFFIGGYFFYAALYAIMGVALGENNEQSQTLNMIVTTPLIITVFAVTAIISQPNSSLAVWTSFIPFCAPITMPVRLAFGVPLWQTILSIIILYGSFILATAFAAKIYRTGILMYGKKITLKEIWHWLRQ